jgi:hypothetical protein
MIKNSKTFRSWASANTLRNPVLQNGYYIKLITARPTGQQTRPGIHLYGLIQKQTVTSARLQTGHCWLNQYLHFNIVEDSGCLCRHALQTAQDYVPFRMPNEEPYKELRTKVGRRNMCVSSMYFNACLTCVAKELRNTQIRLQTRRT